MFNNHTYLYVEDDPRSREIMQVIMQNAMGIERLTIFDSSEDFLQNLKVLSPPPDVILLDIHMTPLNGFEILNLIRADEGYEQATVIAITASVMSEEVAQLQHSGFDGGIAKPLSVRTFPGLMERILNGEAVWHITDI